ncbi:unnamed protein product [Protopolystoma xenopodis]|uniref:Uncharacterized protein n=1 Tax=Protopolystoma xenopodis TaxID=117903 RepID=A0A3S5A5Q3_9PLAT|nr:unnamed protein product [Protopolystoma xenopodis]
MKGKQICRDPELAKQQVGVALAPMYHVVEGPQLGPYRYADISSRPAMYRSGMLSSNPLPLAQNGRREKSEDTTRSEAKCTEVGGFRCDYTICYCASAIRPSDRYHEMRSPAHTNCS